MIENLKIYYKYFNKKVFNNRIEFTEKNLKTISNFSILLLKEYGESIGEDWLFEYLTFQFNKFHSAETKMKLQLNWIYGKKALEKYKIRNDESSFFNQRFRQDFNIRRRDLFRTSNEPLSSVYKHRERNRYIQSTEKLLHCIELRLYDEKTADCKFCKNRKYCQTIKN